MVSDPCETSIAEVGESIRAAGFRGETMAREFHITRWRGRGVSEGISSVCPA